LDVGCGAGLLLGLMAGLGREFEGVGFDVSRRAIEVAKDMAQHAAKSVMKARLSFHRLDIDAAWPAGTFDVVFLVDVLHHVHPHSQRQFFQRVISKVKGGGTLVYKDMCHRPRWKAQANRLHDLLLARQRISYVPVHTVEHWAGLEGMQVLHREDISRLWYGHELRVMKSSNSGSDEL
jgi:2-polyprenyl-3-methyl-5-hydroxy-6-metoxy-1,4-benzoquinol methylase